MDSIPISQCEASSEPRRLSRCHADSADEPGAVERPRRSMRAARRKVVQVVSEFMRSHAAEGVRVAEASRAAGVSERTVRNAFQREHGISPKQFDLRERLLAARTALSEVSPRTVTEIATEFGFFELGRFSRIYRDAFGELPSETIKAHAGILRRAS
jgi:transcriptional regulator GlxA family with amidase domain